MEATLRPFVYDSPLERPMFKNIRYLCPIFNAMQQQLRFEQALRDLRTLFQETIKQPMVIVIFVVWLTLLVNLLNDFALGGGYALALRPTSVDLVLNWTAANDSGHRRGKKEFCQNSRTNRFQFSSEWWSAAQMNQISVMCLYSKSS